jgi:ribosomal protein L21E
LLRLQEFEFTMCHISGIKHKCPDFLSRQEADWDPHDENEFEAELEIPAYFHDLLDVKAAQLADAQLKPIIDKLKSNEDSLKTRNFLLKDDILYRKGASTRGNLNLLVIPSSLKQQLMSTFHEDPLHGAHLSFFKCFDKIKLRFYWVGMLKDVKSFIKSCPVCQTFNKPTQQKNGNLQPVARPSIPFIKIGIDFAGPFVTSSAGNKMLILAVDYHSNWVELKAIRRATAEATANFLLERFICRTGIFHEIVCDRGSQFTSNLFQEMIKILNSKIVKISTYHPMANGRTERMVKTVKSVIAKYCEPNQRNWDSLIPQIQFSINTSPHKTMKETPYAMVYNRQPLFPAEILDGQEISDDFVREIRDRMAIAEKIVAENYQKQQARDKQRFDATHKPIQFSPGDWVSVQNPTTKIGLSKKLLPNYYGPKEIVEKVSDTTYRVKTSVGTHSKTELVNIRRLKPFFLRHNQAEADTGVTQTPQM